MRIDEGFGHEIAASVDLCRRAAIEIFTDGNNAAVLDANLSALIAAAEPGAADGDIERLIHGSISIEDRNHLAARPTYTPAVVYFHQRETVF